MPTKAPKKTITKLVRIDPLLNPFAVSASTRSGLNQADWCAEIVEAALLLEKARLGREKSKVTPIKTRGPRKTKAEQPVVTTRQRRTRKSA